MSQLFPVMYAKLFSRIAQSSLMEEKVTTRYVFMMMLALSDRNGDVIGTDVAIARMMNVSVDEFKSATEPLLSPDPDSNSQAEEGRRLVPSDNGRGYKIVNYLCYRDMKSEEEKREYMRNYMRERRSKGDVKSVKSGKNEKTDVKNVTHTEAEADSNTDSNKKNTPNGEEDEIFAKWNSFPELPKIARITDKRRSAARTRLKDPFFREHWKAGIEAIPQRPFLLGKNDRGWKADIDWFLTPEAITKIVEGKYQSHQPAQKQLAIHHDPFNERQHLIDTMP